MRRLAAVGPGDRLQVLRPPPSGFERPVQDWLSCDVDHAALPLPAKGRVSSGFPTLLISRSAIANPPMDCLPDPFSFSSPVVRINAAEGVPGLTSGPRWSRSRPRNADLGLQRPAAAAEHRAGPLLDHLSQVTGRVGERLVGLGVDALDRRCSCRHGRGSRLSSSLVWGATPVLLAAPISRTAIAKLSAEPGQLQSLRVGPWAGIGRGWSNWRQCRLDRGARPAVIRHGVSTVACGRSVPRRFE